MSAFVVSKTHVDLMVKAAVELSLPKGQPGLPNRFGWWAVDEDGDFAGWRYIDRYADGTDEQRVSPSQAGQMLVSECVESVAYRYCGDTDPDEGDLPGPIDAYYMGPYVYEDPGHALSPGEVFKAIDCYDYQSCEHPGWRSSEAFAFCTALRERTCALVAGYAEAPWGYDAAPMRVA